MRREIKYIQLPTELNKLLQSEREGIKVSIQQLHMISQPSVDISMEKWRKSYKSWQNSSNTVVNAHVPNC